MRKILIFFAIFLRVSKKKCNFAPSLPMVGNLQRSRTLNQLISVLFFDPYLKALFPFWTLLYLVDRIICDVGGDETSHSFSIELDYDYVISLYNRYS